jgi:iron complex outermembrane receptor protein
MTLPAAFDISLRTKGRFRRFWAGMLGLLLGCISLHAQEGRGAIQGRVQDPASGDYLANARVVVEGTGQEALTDSTGFYQLPAVRAGDVTLRVTYLNFDAAIAQVPVAAGRSVTRDFALTNKARYGTDAPVINLEPFTVATTREEEASGIAIAEQRYAQIQKKVLAADAFGEVSENNVGEFLKRMPGVTVNYAEGDAASISLRGFSDMHTSILIDGNSISSGGSSNPTRLVDLENLSVGNASRLEVIKTVLPNQWANSLGGSVNMVSKSSFERTRPLLIARAVVQFTNDDHSFGSSPGPGWRNESKMRPGGGFSHVYPISKNLGITASANYSDQFGRRTASQTGYEFVAGANNATGGSETAPYLRTVRLSNNERSTVREAYGFGVDWRPAERLTLHFNYQYNALDLFTSPRFVTLNSGAAPVSKSATETIGRVGAGTVQWGSTTTHKMTDTNVLSLRSVYRGGDWKFEGATAYSYSDVKYRTMDEGFFRGITLRIPSPTVRFGNASGNGTIPDIEVLTGTGNNLTPIDWTRLSNARIIDSTGNHRQNGSTEDTQLRLSATRNLNLGRVPASVEFGGATKTFDRRRKWTRHNFTYRGPDGIANSADDGAGVVLDTTYGSRNYRYGWPESIQWFDLSKLYGLYAANPSHFVRDDAGDYLLSVQADDGFKETISALYTQGEVKLLNGRVTFTGGVRYERTEDSAYGYKSDQTKGLQFPAGSLERTMAQNIPRSTRVAFDYDDFFPSVATTVSLRENLMLRVGYSQTIGRPELDELIPRVTETDTNVDGYDGTLNARNPALKPWSADNYDVSLEYYFNGGHGVVSIGAFHKVITNPFAGITGPLTPEAAALLGYDYAAYSNYRFVTRYNSGQDAKITGWEFDYRQQIGSLNPFAKGLTLFANGTLLDLDGSRDADFEQFYPKTANWGFTYSRGRVKVDLSWNYNGGRKTANLTWAPTAENHILPRTVLDMSSEFRLSKNFWLFAAARNLTNSHERIVAYSDNSPAYSRLQTLEDFNVKWAVGVRARF